MGTRSAMTPGNDLPRSNSGVTSEASGSLTRQVSPTMFGGVEALVESQDWWLRDQASLAIGFDNWMSTGSETMASTMNGTRDFASARVLSLFIMYTFGVSIWAARKISLGGGMEGFMLDDG